MIRISELEKRYGSLRAVDGISFSVGRGEVMGFLGPNGAGKTTTMRMIAGFLPPDSGQVTIDDIDVVRNPQRAQALLGYLPEGAPSYPEMTPVQFLRFCGQARGMPANDLKIAIDVAVERTGLGDVTGQTIGTLSKGYRRRVGIAQAILHDPPALILDEPTDGLDPNQKHAVRKLIQAMAPEKAIIISTHILEEVDAVCTRAAIIAHGKILADTTPDALAETAPGHGDIRMEMDNGTAVTASRHLIKHPLIADLTAISGDDNNVAFVIRPKGGQVILPELVALSQRHGWPLRSLSVRRGKLEDVFRAVTRPDGPMPRKLDADKEQEEQP